MLELKFCSNIQIYLIVQGLHKTDHKITQEFQFSRPTLIKAINLHIV